MKLETRIAAPPVTGVVFDLQRCALHDGPGIRTTVFLKGCPLRCLWCHNPESQRFQPEQWNRAAGASGAPETIGRVTTVDEVMATVLRDADYYRRSGGGLTLSGGEPMAQFPFAQALLRAARRHGLHTCVDTSGQARQSHFQAVLEEVDLFLYDYKATDPAEHRRLTGASNDVILSNLDFLYRRGARIVLRCPLVPGVNDGPEHLRGIAALAARYPALAGVEIMPYHDMGREKAVRLGRAPALPGVRTTDEETKRRWLDELAALGCTRAVMG